MEKKNISALCTKTLNGRDGIGFVAGAVYACEHHVAEKKYTVFSKNGKQLLLTRLDFASHFQRKNLELPPQLEQEDSTRWKEVMNLAKQYGFIVQAFGGTATLISRRIQLAEMGLSDFLRIQAMNGIERSTLGYPLNGEPPIEKVE